MHTDSVEWLEKVEAMTLWELAETRDPEILAAVEQVVGRLVEESVPEVCMTEWVDGYPTPLY